MNKKQACRAVAFLAVVFLLLHICSVMSVRMTRSKDPVYSVLSTDLLQEPENTIDVIAFGSSNVYSSIMPLEWWNSFGFTGYDFAEASQRAPQTKLAVEQIYKKQSPKVILLDVATLFNEKNDLDAYDSTVKAYLEQVFPVIRYHRFFSDPRRLKNLTAEPGSLTKGYLIRDGAEPGRDRNYMKKGKKDFVINSVIRKQFEDVIAYCQEQGSTVILLEIPENASWNLTKHQAISEFAKEKGLTFLDLNLEMKSELNWATDTVDGGNHMNTVGAKKVTDFLGRYLTEQFDLQDRRKDSKLAEKWNADYQVQKEELDRLQNQSDE